MSSTQELNQICNIAGYPMYPWAIDQLRKRSDILGYGNRFEEEINYLGNKGAWIRVVSSVDLEEPFIKYFKDQYGAFTGFTDQSSDAGDAANLAKNFVLFGGTSIYQSKTNNLLRSGINAGGSYGILGDTEINEYGYKPMPGITSVTVESMGRMGSVRQATVNFRVSDKMQLDVMDALYFRPGFTLLIEYGHAKYIDNNGNLQSTEQYMIDPFDENYSKESIGIEISRNVQKSAGNYGGMLSVITSFNFSITQDGGYDCVLKTIAMGGVMGNYPVNNLSILPDIYIENAQNYIDQQKQIEINTKRKEAEDAKKAALAQIQKSTNDNWADLGIKDPLANLLYNTKNQDFLNNAKDGLNTAAVSVGVAREQYSAISVDRAVKDFKFQNRIKQDPKNNDIGVIKVGSDAIFIQNNIFKIIGYLATTKLPNQQGDVFVNINSSIVNDILKNAKAQSGNSDFFDNFETLTPNDRYVDWLTALRGRGRVLGKNFVSIVDYTLPSVPDIQYRIAISYPNTAIAKENSENVYLNIPDPTKWKVIAINGEGVILQTEDRQYTLELGGDGKVADFSFISNIVVIDPNQDLIKNKRAEQIEAIEQQFQDAITAATNVAAANALAANAKTLKAIANSQSALELMLRSVMLFAIDEPDDGSYDLDTGFIQRLFSEGVYSSIFTKNGIPQQKDYQQSDFDSYINGSMPASTRLEVNLRFGNSARLMSAENISKDVNLLKEIPQVDFQSMFKVVTLSYGQAADTGIVNGGDPIKKSIYIPLGFFFLMLNHTGMLYSNKKDNDILVPVTYVDFNPSTNFYLSSVNQFSVDPFKFIMPYYGKEEDYRKLFKKEVLLSNDTINLNIPNSTVQPHPIFNFDAGADVVSLFLPNNKKGLQNGDEDGYIGRTMDVMVNINYLLEMIKSYRTGDDFGEAYFQSILEDINASLNKSTGYYNAFRLSYSDSANVFMIVDDQIQQKPDSEVQTAISNILGGVNAPEIPIQGKGSIARSFDIRTDISSRVASMIAISSNPVPSDQVGMGKNTSDFGVYNIGSHDRYMKRKTSNPSNNTTAIQDNVQECQAAISFDTVVSSIYGLANNVATDSIDPNDIQQAAAYYKEKMARVKNEQEGSAAAMIIPIKTSITMDGFSGIYPFQLFTINENMLPYRYSSTNLNDSKVAFSTTRLTHNFSNNEWTTSIEGLMTFLKESDTQETTAITQTSAITTNFTTAAAGNEVPVLSDYPNILFPDNAIGGAKNTFPSKDKIYKPLLQDIQEAASALGNDFKVSITTAVSGHNKTTNNGNTSRHATGNAVDIAIINGKAVNNVTNRSDADKFVAELKKLGYSLNVSEIGGPEKTIFWIFPNHYTHVHVGYRPAL
jgi:hypothetical protein